MADMVDCGYATFKAWQRQTPTPQGRCWHNRWLGEFDPSMTADEAGRRLENHKLVPQAQVEFKRGWEKAQGEYVVPIAVQGGAIQ